MKSLLTTTSLIVITTLFSGCFDHDFCTVADGYNETREFYLSDFDGINLGIAANVIITKGNNQRVVVEGQQEILNELSTLVNNGIWNITLDECYRKYDDINIYITTPDLNYIALSGSGTISSQKQLNSTEMNINMPGSGTIDLGIDTNNLTTNLSGSGNISLSGIANESNITISGSGNIFSNELNTNATNVRISGSGNTFVFAQNYLDISITGSGNVYYKGYPEITVSKSTSGNVIDNN